MQVARLKTIGAGRPTGAGMSPGRGAGLGGTCAAARAAGFQSVLPVHGQLHRGRGPEPGRFLADLTHAAELPASFRSVSHVAHQRHAQPAGGSLPAHAARPADGFDRRRYAEAGEQAIRGAHAGQAGLGVGIECATATRIVATFAGIARGSNLARFAGTRLQ
jgi:hypothetical protein